VGGAAVVTTDDPWVTDHLDLPAYLARVGVGSHPPSRAALDELHAAHVRTFSFDNVDVLLEQHAGVALDAVQAKFVGRGRGGYCFEHSTLFAAVLERLGYDVRRHLGRVGDPAAAPRTHMVVEVRIEGLRLLADPGFGMSVLRPIVLDDGVEEDHDGWRYRVDRVSDDDGSPAWRMSRHRDGGWEVMHTTDELTVRPIDVAMGHHFTSTGPGSHFRTGLMVTRHRADEHVSLTFETVTVRRPGQPTEHRPLDAGELETLLHELGGGLTDDEVGRLLAHPARPSAD
jgi:N-hydroxyarylamine O-acetyltransferase